MMATNLTVVATQAGIKTFRNMTRLRFLTSGGAPTESLNLPNVDLTPQDYIKIIPDPSSQPMAADVIEIKADRTVAGNITIGSSNGSNLPADLACELVLIKRQMGDGQTTTLQVGNNEDSLFGLRDEGGYVSHLLHTTAITVPSPQITADSIVWIDQKTQCVGLTGGLDEEITSRVPGESFSAYKANSTDTPNNLVGFDWIIFQP